MTKDEALKLALEALENINNWLPTIGQKGLRDYEADVITAIKEILVQPEQLPVAIQVGRVYWDDDKLMAVPIAPPQREWIGLTDSEVDNIVAYPWGETKNWIKAIEDALKEKNT